jgi:hypothetical protein
MEDVMKNPDVEVIPPKPTKALGIALWTAQITLAMLFLFAGVMKFVMPVKEMTRGSSLPGSFFHFIGAMEVLGAIGLVLPCLLRIALSNSRCGLWSCDHHGGSDCNVHNDGLDLAPPVVRRRCRGFHRVWPLQTAAYSTAPVIRAAFYVVSHEQVRGRTAFTSLTLA